MPNAAQFTSVSPTPRRVPEPYLRAEIAAFPLTSEEAFRACLVELDPQLATSQVAATRKTGNLWQTCENRFTSYSGWSLDRLIAARDRGWFGAHPIDTPISMYSYLYALANDHLVARPGVTEIKESTDLTAVDAVDHYRWLTFTLPEDLLLSALGAEPAPNQVEFDPPLLVRQLLDLGVAEIHQHIGAGMDFPLLWASALAAIATPAVDKDELVSPGAPLSNGENLVLWLLAAAIARSTIAEFLIRGEHNFKLFVGGYLTPRWTVWTPRRRETLATTLNALLVGDERLLPDFESLQDLYADIHPSALTLNDDKYRIKSVADAFQRCDPIAVRLNLHGFNAGERWYLRKAFRYLAENQYVAHHPKKGRQYKHDDYFPRIFWQTIRVRCQYYRTVVERPLTGGLQWFIRFYDRLGELRDPIKPILAQASYRVAGKGHRIRALEIRTSMADTAIEIGDEVLDFLRSWKQVLEDNSSSIFEPEMGIIFHFVKGRDRKRKDSRQSKWSKGTPAAFWAETHAEPEKESGMDVMHGRYVSYFAKQCGKALALAELINAVPSCLWVIRGLDVANDELGIPTWVLAPLFRYLVNESARASIIEEENGIAPLKVTAHVGEDFRHLLEGMRRIYEHVHYVLNGVNGRLGHAIALGVEPQAWAESVGSVLIPAEVRLWDLVWEWRLYTKYRIKPEFTAAAPPGRIEILLNKVCELSEYIYGKDGYKIDELAEAHHVLHQFLVPPFTHSYEVDGAYDTFLQAARNIRNAHHEVHSALRVSKLLEAYLDDEHTFKKGQTLVDIPLLKDEIDALNAVQYALRRGIAQRGIVIEVNPSSNLLIGDLLDLRNHPILRLNPPVPEQNAPPPVAIALGSDDPLTFSTDLLQEYTLLHQAACAAGYPEHLVHEWLESIRRTGMDARFTLGWRPSARYKINSLEKDLCDYLHEPNEAKWDSDYKLSQ
jgi:hypothetical protein